MFVTFNPLYQGFSQLGVFEPHGVGEKFQGMQIIVRGYANYSIGGTPIKKMFSIRVHKKVENPCSI